MAVTALPVTAPTILDVAKVTDPNGKIMPRVMALQQRNTFLQSMVWKEGNMDVGHQISRQTALPSVTWVDFNEGVAPGKGLNDTFNEKCGMLAGLSSVDVRLADLNGNAAAYRASLDDDYLAAMANTLESAFFYESTLANPRRILGLAPRLNSTTGKFGNQIIKGGGASTDNQSIFLIGWGERTVYGISPRGSGTGLKMEDMGKVRTLDANNNVLYKYETQFEWKCGLCVEDYRYVVRICNIASTALTATAASGADLLNLMVQAYWNIFDPNAVRLAWYCNRRIASFLHQQALSKTSNSTLSIEPAQMIGAPGVFGKPIVHCMGAPIYVSDALSITETLVS